MCQFIHLCRFTGREMARIIEFPKSQPVLKMFRLQPQAHMRARKPAGVAGSATSLQSPKFGYLFQMGLPILDLGIKDRPQNGVLANVGVKGSEEAQNPLVSANSFVK